MIVLQPAAAALALDAIEAGFPDRPFPAGAALVQQGRWFDEKGQPHAYDNPEAEAVEQLFSRRPWKKLKGRELLDWCMTGSSLFHLTPEALAYYLPAYMTAFLTERVDSVGFILLGTLLSVLTPPAERPSATFAPTDTRSPAQKDAMSKATTDRFSQIVSSLNLEQRAAVAAFLEAVEPAFEGNPVGNDARIALNAFWCRFTSARLVP